MRFRKSLLEVAHEAIQYQVGSPFFPELTTCLQRMIDQGVFSATTINEFNIAETIKKHTGLTVSLGLIHDSYPNAQVIIKHFNTNDVFSDWFKLGLGPDVYDGLRYTARALKRLDPTMSGAIDLKNGKVTGIFSKIKSHISVTSGCFQQASAEEIAAIILHEVGHIFTYFWVLTKTVSTNLAVQIASNALSKTTSQVERIKLVTEFQATIPSTIDDVTAMTAGEQTEEEYQSFLLQATTRFYTRSDTDAPVYELTSDEYMADRFVAMWGAGRAHVVFDDRINSTYNKRYKQSMTAHVITEAVKLGTSILKNSFKLAFPPCWYFWPITTIASLRYDFRDFDRYDEPIDRIQRIRQSLIQVLKDRSLPEDERKKLTSDIIFIGELIEGAKDHRSLFDVIWTSLSKSRRHRFNQKQFQKELEFTINNNLFVHSSKLSQLIPGKEASSNAI